MSQKLATYAERFAERHRVNGQPNGYRPITEAELQAKHQAERDAKFAFKLENEVKEARRLKALELPKVA